MNKDGLDHLRNILLEEEVSERQKLESELAALIEEIKIRDKLENNVGPIIQDKLDDLRDRFPEIYGDVITETIKKQIADSQDEVVDALYPIIGQLIKKYIRKEIELLSERIESELDRTLDWNIWLRKIKSLFIKSDESDIVISNALPPLVEEVFLIETESGLLYASYSKNNTLDQDMIAAMLTAIKSFVEDAFQGKNQQLEWIEYETYKIHIHSLKRFNIAFSISGLPNAEFKEKLDDAILEFDKKVLTEIKKLDEVSDNDVLNQKLKSHFENL